MDFDKAYDVINTIKQKAHGDKKITESVEHSAFNSIRKDYQNEKSSIFKPTTLSQLINQVDFIPFLQERDGLGKLIVNNFQEVRPVKIIKMRKNKKILEAALSEFTSSVEKKGSLTNLILENVDISDMVSNSEDNALGELPRTQSNNQNIRKSSSKEQTVYEIRKLAAKGIRNSIVSSSSMRQTNKRENLSYDKFEYKSKLGSSDYSANTKWAEEGVGSMKHHDPSLENREIKSATSCFRSMSREDYYRKLKKEVPEDDTLKTPLKLRYELIDKKITKDFTIAKDHDKAPFHDEDERIKFTNLSENFSKAFDLNKNPVDINKQLPRFQALHKWAPAIYENDKEVKPERKRGYKELNIKALEKDFDFQMLLQRKYYRKVQKPTLTYKIKKYHLPANKEELLEKLSKSAQRYALKPANMVNGELKKFLKL